MKNSKAIVVSTLVPVVSLLFVSIPPVAIADDIDDNRQGLEVTRDGGDVAAALWEQQQVRQAGQPTSGPVTTAGDDTTRQSNTAAPASEAGAYFDFAHCALESNPFGDDPFTHGSWVLLGLEAAGVTGVGARAGERAHDVAHVGLGVLLRVGEVVLHDVVGVGLGVNLHVAHEALGDIRELVRRGFKHRYPFWFEQGDVSRAPAGRCGR